MSLELLRILAVLTNNSSARKSRGFPHVTMVQTTDFWQFNYLSQFGSLNGSQFRGVTSQR